MSDLEKVRQWLLSWEGMTRMDGLRVDFYGPQPENGSLAPAGLTEIARYSDILGRVTVENQYAFALYFQMEWVEGETTRNNADWLLSLQKWIQTQCLAGLAPRFGENQRIRAMGGALESVSEEGTAVYCVKLAIQFVTRFMPED